MLVTKSSSYIMMMDTQSRSWTSVPTSFRLFRRTSTVQRRQKDFEFVVMAPGFTVDLAFTFAVTARFQRHNRSIPSFWDLPGLAKT